MLETLNSLENNVIYNKICKNWNTTMNCGTYLYLPEEYSLFIQIFILYFVMRREQRFAKMQIFAYDFKIVFYEIQNWQVHFFTKKKNLKIFLSPQKTGITQVGLVWLCSCVKILLYVN